MASLGYIEKKNNDRNSQHPKIHLAFADRLKPTCSQRPSMSSEETSNVPYGYSLESLRLNQFPHQNGLSARIERSRNSPHGSPTQHRAKAIIRKYRRHVRHVEFKRLRSIVPAVAGNEKASQVRFVPPLIYVKSFLED